MIRTIFIIITWLLVGKQIMAQAVFRTIVPLSPVVEGESFRVQFVVEDAQLIGQFTPPSFRGFRVVSGPEMYSGQAGSAIRPMRNVIYTLEALEPGRYFLQGAVAVIDGQVRHSNDVLLEVISRETAYRQKLADDQALYLKPGEDPYEKIRQNLFLKVLLDKKTCYTGEPVVATFKLYSRLQSRSDIIKNPGFYGFAVQDMINLDNKVMTTETVNGQKFDVHTIRKVQLYPLQAGLYTVDPMEVKNKVVFSRSQVNRKAEQEIIEGVFEEEDEAPAPGTEEFESNIRTVPVTIRVRSLPEKNRPESFNGATGIFTIDARLEKEALAKNEEGYLLVSIRGRGNFQQLDAPVIHWPAGVEGFEPTVADALDNMSVPVSGARTFRYAFVAARPGEYQLPALEFSFFDPGSNRYKKTNSAPVRLHILNREKEKPVAGPPRSSLAEVNRKASLVAGGIVVAAVLLALLYWIAPARRKKKEPVKVEKPENKLPSPEEVLRPAWLLLPAADRDFYSILYQSVWKWLSQRFDLAGTGQNKRTLAARMKEAGKDNAVTEKLIAALEFCEAGMYTNASLGIDREKLLDDMQDLLQEIKG